MESLCSRGKQVGLSVSAGGFNHIFGTETRAVRPAGWGGMQHMLCSLTAARLPGSVICVQHALSSLGKKALENRFPRSFLACRAAGGRCAFRCPQVFVRVFGVWVIK